ncbi:MAG TPA: sigma-70 family RNA polymerase sigma factor [Acidimicrobiales bacterium]|nr:sigma-70 family RNA polymerase sigma factor [Acidimicrobiales bacterium]
MRRPRPDDAFEAAFDRLFPRAEHLARRILGDEAAAEDVAAETMARLCLHWPRMHEAAYLDGWVLRIAANLAIDATRRKPLRIPAPAARPEDDAVALRHALVAALRHLSRRQREVIALHYLSDLSEADVAAALGISAGSVKTHTSRGLAALRQRLGDTEEVPLALRT